MKPCFSLVIFLLFVQLSLAIPRSAVPVSVVGTWQGKCTVSLSVTKDAVLAQQKDTVDVKIIILKDGSVQGKISGAKMVNCQVHKNRGWADRLLHIKTDFIIKSGYLDGAVCSADTIKVKNFTLPFNIVNGKKRGSVMQVFKWKYPFPLVKILLTKSQNLK